MILNLFNQVVPLEALRLLSISSPPTPPPLPPHPPPPPHHPNSLSPPPPPSPLPPPPPPPPPPSLPPPPPPPPFLSTQLEKDGVLLGWAPPPSRSPPPSPPSPPPESAVAGDNRRIFCGLLPPPPLPPASAPKPAGNDCGEYPLVGSAGRSHRFSRIFTDADGLNPCLICGNPWLNSGPFCPRPIGNEKNPTV